MIKQVYKKKLNLIISGQIARGDVNNISFIQFLLPIDEYVIFTDNIS